jgi:hypothetical protein
MSFLKKTVVLLSYKTTPLQITGIKNATVERINDKVKTNMSSITQ